MRSKPGLRGMRYGPTRIGGAGVLDTVVLAGLIGVVLAEIIGEVTGMAPGRAGPFSRDAGGSGQEPEQTEGGADAWLKEEAGTGGCFCLSS